MNLPRADFAFLKEHGYSENEIKQIAYAAKANVTKYSVSDGDGERRITKSEAIGILGREGWLTGIMRSAFHWTAARTNEAETQTVYFDSSSMFKN